MLSVQTDFDLFGCQTKFAWFRFYLKLVCEKNSPLVVRVIYRGNIEIYIGHR